MQTTIRSLGSVQHNRTLCCVELPGTRAVPQKCYLPPTGKKPNEHVFRHPDRSTTRLRLRHLPWAPASHH
ncbi:hypothetical protein XFEB_01991 [Xylella fastidiosa EB92.1]|nr:hypothetical protein XFEB_01991 [Xylella fastidiosa EB92.1]